MRDADRFALAGYARLDSCMAVFSAAIHAARVNGHREESLLSDPEATERCLTSIGNTERSVRTPKRRIYDDIVE